MLIQEDEVKILNFIAEVRDGVYGPLDEEYCQYGRLDLSETENDECDYLFSFG